MSFLDSSDASNFKMTFSVSGKGTLDEYDFDFIFKCDDIKCSLGNMMRDEAMRRILFKVRWEFHNAREARRARITQSVCAQRALCCRDIMTTSGVTALQHCSITSHEYWSKIGLNRSRDLNTGLWLVTQLYLTSEHPLSHRSAVFSPDDRIARRVGPGHLTCNRKMFMVDKNLYKLYSYTWYGLSISTARPVLFV